MRSSSPLTRWLATNGAFLSEQWSGALAHQLERLLAFPREPQLVEQAHGLLLGLAELMQHPLSAGGVDEQLRSVLKLVGTLQNQWHLTKAEIVVLLFTLRDAVQGAAQEQSTEQASTPLDATEADGEIAELGNLLGRLGLVFLEASESSTEESELPADSQLDYALRYERARQMAITDSLTGLANFGYFRERLSEERRRAERYQRLLSLIIFDLDHFKQYNDKHGHPAGNQVLVNIAAILRREARETDLAARYGGEELVLVLPEANRKTAWEVAERIRECVAETLFQPAGVRVTLSAGVATFPVDATDDEQLVQCADKSLYQAKAAGRNRVVFHRPPHRVTLVYHPERWVEEVALVGSFNGWDKQADPMQRRPDGAFEFEIALAPGDYRYKFVLNGSAWTPDPANSQTQPDNMGGVNSVLTVETKAT